MAEFSGLFGEDGSYSLIHGDMPSRAIAKRLSRKPGFRKMKELLDTLIGATAGSAALSTYVRVAEDSGQGGGVRTLETVTVINRNSAAADTTDLKEMLVNYDPSPSYPADASGNGGPAFS